MFQGSPNEAIRNRVPLAYDPATLDVVLLTHAHLDHCGLIPHLVNEGYRGRIIATTGTCELAELVLLDSGKLQEEFAKREARWEKRHPDGRRRRTTARSRTTVPGARSTSRRGRIAGAAGRHERVDDAPPPLTPRRHRRSSATLASAAPGGGSRGDRRGSPTASPDVAASSQRATAIDPEADLRGPARRGP